MGRIKVYLHECPLDFTIRARTLGEPPAADSVDLVHEDDARLVLARVSEHFAYHTRTLANVLVHDSTRDDLQEVRIEGSGNSTCQESLARSGGAGEAVFCFVCF